MSTRFRPPQRLHSPPEFAAVFSARHVSRGQYFDLLLGGEISVQADGDNEKTGAEQRIAKPAHARLGLIVPKRLARHAVLRNAMKRQAREAFRHNATSLPARDLVIRLTRWPREMVLLSGASAELKRLLRQEIEQLLARCADRYGSRC